MVPTPTIIPGSGVQLTTSQDAEKVTYLMTPRHSMTVTNTKGLLNMPGQNNCFLNSAVQVLWHLDIFRRSFRELLSHACMGESCIFCALKELFTQFQYSQESALPPDALRHALAKTFCDQRRFQLGFMDDAAECFENILLRIHVHIANQEHEDMCGDARCIPHQKFAMTLVEQPMCHNCGTTSEPLPFTQMVHYVTTSALCAKAQENLNHGPEFSSALSFGKLLKQAGDMGEVRDCPGGCGSKIHMKKTLMNHPEIVSIGLVWDSECPSLQHITDVFHSIGMYVRLQDMFHAVLDTEWADSTSHELVGVVTYYGKHYSTFFFHTKLRVWIYFDDAAVREIGPSWDQVVEKCQKGRFQPLLLLFANPNGTSLSPSVFYHEKSATLKPGATIKNSPKIATQRQAVINRYLAFQKSIQNGNSLTTGALNQSDLGYLNNQSFLNSESSSKSLLPKPSNLYQMRNQVLPTMRCKQCGHLNSQSFYNRCKCSSDKSHSFANSQSIVNESNINQSQPIYSNSQMFRNSVANALPPFLHDSKDISKANEAALPPIVTPKLSARNSVQPFVPMNTNVELQQVANTSKSQEYLTKIENKDLIDHSKDSDSAYAEDDLEINDTYISRKAVENVLNMQKLRQISLSRPYSHGAIGNRNSSSSLESFDNIHSNKSCNTQKESHVLDAENVRIRRDSGNWSSDRNSSSSLSNSSVDNSFLAVVASKRLLLGLNNCHVPSGKSQLPDFSNASNSDHGYDSYSVSSSDSYPSVTGSPVKLDPRLTLIPEDWQGQDNLSDLDKKLLMITEDSSGPPDCDKLCAEADLLLAKSHDKEKEGDLIMAALLSDSAAARARTAMDAPYNNSRSLVSAKMKHSTCVMRSSCLYRRIKDNEAEERRKQKGMTGQHSRQSSRDSTHGRHSRQGSKDGTATKQTKKENGNHVVDENDSLGRNIEIYGTLPKKGSRRKLMSPTGSSRAKDEQVYEDFLDKQRKNINAACVSNDHSPKSSKLPGKLEISKSKIEISEKQSKKSVSEIAAPKSPLRKARDVIMDGNNEDFKGTAHVKKHNSKSCNPEHSSSRSSFNKETDLSNDDEITSKDLLSPIGSTDKKQHKIKRKLMGGFMKRKNRSLPDLREDQDLSDALDRSFDDSSIQMSPTLTLPNGKLKKLEYQPDPTVNGVTRGFHQPHYAFVKKDLSHRPLLMKVNPPNIQSTPSLNNMKNKPIHTLPSLPKKIPEPKSKANSDLQIECKSSTPSYFSTSEIGLPAFSLQLPLKPTEILASSDSHLQKNSEIPSLISQSNCVTSSSKLNTVEVQMAFPSDSNGSKDELPFPANPFLAELQAKRRQIIGNFDPNKKVNYHQDTEEKPKQTLLPCLKEISSKQSGLTSNNEGTSWLQELQNKQQQMLMQNKQQQKLMQNKQQQTLVIALPKAEQNECQDVSKIATKLLDSTSDSKFAENKEMKKPEVEKGKGSMKPQSLKNSEKITDGTKDNHCSNTVSSVRNLASRFEKIIKDPTAFNVSTSVAAPGTAANSTDNLNKHSSRPVFSPSTITNNDYKRTETIFQEGTLDDNSEERKMITLEKNVTEAPLCPQNPSLASEQDDLNSKVSNGKGTQQSAVKSEMDVAVGAEDLCDTKGFIPQHRPQAPPDYETALQRLELIRTAPLGEVSQQPDNEMTLPPILSSPTVSSAIAERKRQGPKKTVTFSDKVVLVACADFEEDFMPNPLLERVYQQQCESSGTEGLKYDSPLDYRTQSCENVFPYSNYQSQFPENNVKSTSSPTLQGTVSCHLCHSKYVMPPTIYCTDCEFYMSRFQA